MNSNREKEILEKKRKKLLDSNSEENPGKNPEERDGPVHLTENNFQEIVQDSKKLAFVDFWAPWCAPCRMMAPIVEDLAEEYAGEVIVGKLNLEEGNNRQIAQNYQVSGIPTFILFKEGEPIKRIVGGRKKADMKEMIENYL